MGRLFPSVSARPPMPNPTLGAQTLAPCSQLLWPMPPAPDPSCCLYFGLLGLLALPPWSFRGQLGGSGLWRRPPLSVDPGGVGRCQSVVTTNTSKAAPGCTVWMPWPWPKLPARLSSRSTQACPLLQPCPCPRPPSGGTLPPQASLQVCLTCATLITPDLSSECPLATFSLWGTHT